MIILGLGSNVGDRLTNLRKALAALHQLPHLTIQQISPLYVSDALLPENAPPEWDMPHLNLAMRCETTLAPLELLDQLKNIEWTIGRKPTIRHWGPRILDIDILAWDEQIIQNERLTIPHTNLQERPFALWPLADVAPNWIFPLPGKNHGQSAENIARMWGSRFTGQAPFRTRQILQRIDTPKLVGIINATPDSFSDGGLFLNPDHAVKQAIQLVEDGAEILDIGAESTAPHAKPLSVTEEWERLHPILLSVQQAASSFVIPPIISVDTRHAITAEKALFFGAQWINDVSGFDDPAMRELAKKSNVQCVVMHHLGIPPSQDSIIPHDKDPIKFVYAWAENRLQALDGAGIPQDRIIFDPGIGFGKLAEHSLSLIKNIQQFKSLGVKLLVGHSRKSFFSRLTPYAAPERDIETLAASLFLAHQQVDYLRIHQVEWCARAFKVMNSLVDTSCSQRPCEMNPR